MLVRHKPQLRTWYENLETGELFEVVDLDDKTDFIAVQLFDGAIEELDFETFLKLPLRPAPQPEDCSGPFEEENPGDTDSDSYLVESQQNRKEYDEDNLSITEHP